MTVGWFEGADIAFKLQYKLLNSFVDTIGNVLFCVYAKYFDRKWLSLLFLFQLRKSSWTLSYTCQKAWCFG